MTSYKKNILNILLTTLAYIFYYIFRYIIPLKVASKVGFFIGYYILPKLKLTKRDTFLKNISYVFPEKNKKEVFEIYRLSCVNFMQNIFELPKIGSMQKHIIIKDPYNWLHKIQNNNLSFLAFTAHYGNWELIGLPFLNIKGYGIYKAPTNKYINNLILKLRMQKSKKCNFKMITLNKETIIKLMHIGRNGNLRLLMLVDQKVNEGILANFLGKKTKTSHLFPMFAIKYGIPLVPIKIKRVFESKKLKFIITIEQPLDLKNLTNTNDDIVKATELMNYTIGNWIKEDPRQWFWLYNRW